MKNIAQPILIVLICFLLLSCSSKTDSNENQVPVAVQPLSCIVVLPAVTPADNGQSLGSDQNIRLKQGATYATEVMAAELEGLAKVKVLRTGEASSILSGISGGMAGTLAELGEKLNCDGVLMTTVRRFKQREGTELSASSPAIVNFDMTLRHAPTGTILWSADFKETQTAFLENIFSNNKMAKQGFKWLSAEQLMEQGIKERLTSCPYLK